MNTLLKTNNPFAIVIIFLFCSLRTNAQTSEIQEQIEKIEKGTYKAEDSTDIFISQLRSLPEFNNEAYVIYSQGYRLFVQNDFNGAIEKMFAAIKHLEKQPDDWIQAKCHYLAAISYERLTDYKSNLKHLKLAEQKAIISNNERLVRLCYNCYSNFYLDQLNYELALEYAEKALEIAIKLNRPVAISIDYATLGETHRLLGNKQKAEEFFSKAYASQKEMELSALPHTLTNWSLLYDSDIVRQVKMQQEAEEIFEKSDPKNPMRVLNLNNMAYQYFRLGSIDSLRKTYIPKLTQKEFYAASELNYQKSITLATEIGHNNYLSSALINYSILNKEKGDFSKAYENLYRGFGIKENLFSQKSKNELAQINSEHEMERKNAEIELNQIKIESHQKQRWLYFTGLIGLALIGGLLYNQSRIRKKKNSELHELNLELDQANRVKTRFFSILNHDLRSPISNLIHYLHIKKESPEILDDETKLRLENKTIEGAENLLVTMEDLLLWSKGQMENFAPQPKTVSINKLFEDTKKVFSSYQNIRFEYHNPESLEVLTDENYLKTIIRNLTSNAINVFSNTSNPTIVWKAFKQDGKTVLSINDNGPGADSDKFNALYDDKEVVGIKTGLGLHLIRDLAKAINCKIEVNSIKGSGTEIKLLL